MKKFLAVLILCLFPLASVVAKPTLSEEKYFNYCSEAFPTTFSPQVAYDTSTFTVLRGVFNRLVDFEAGSTKVVPSAAKSWSISGDGLEITFQLRQDIYFHSQNGFHPTRPLNADDVIFTFDRMRKSDHPLHRSSGGNYQYFNSLEMNKIIKDIVRIDNYKVKFVLDRPEAPILANLAMDFASLISKEYYEYLKEQKKVDQFDLVPSGSGPFVFVSSKKNVSVDFKRNERYHGERAKIKNLRFLVYTDPAARVEALRSGLCDLIANPRYEDIAALKTDPQLRVVSQPGLNIFYIAFNVKKPPFDKLEVRQALNHALNKSLYIQKGFKGFAQVARNPMPPNMWGFNKSLQDYDYSPQKARALLKKAGFDKGLKIQFSFMSESRPYNPNGKLIADLIVEDLKKIGVQAELKTLPWAEYLKSAQKRDFEILQMGWTSDNGDPDNFLNVLLSCAGVEAGTNYSGWCDKRFSFLVGRARVTTNIVQRTRFYEEAQTIFKKQAPWIPIAHTTVFRAMKKSVTGFKMSPFGVDTFKSVDMKEK